MAPARATQLLRDYVAIPSVNPMGRSDLPADIVGERRYAEHVCAQLRALGLDAVVIGRGERASVVAEARPPGPSAVDTVLIASHLDTVPVDGMEIAPFDPRLEGGRLFGRGSCDTKGGLAALVDALGRVLARGTLRRRVVVLGEADEEFTSEGVRDALAHLGSGRAGIDWVLATEPTGLRVVTHHKGVATAQLEARGRACHASDPAQGRSAISAIARAVLALEALAAELAGRPHPRLGPATLSVGLVGGGAARNIVPDHAWLALDRRVLPGEDEAALSREIEDALARHGASDVAVAALHIAKPPLATDAGHPAVRACQAALAALGRSPEPACAAFGTDAGVFAAHGLPGVVLGPGSIAQAHTAREWVDVAEVEAMAEFFVRLLETPG